MGRKFDLQQEVLKKKMRTNKHTQRDRETGT